MSLAATLDVLKRVPVLRPLDEARLRVIAMTGAVMRLLPGERVAEKGDEGDAAFIILEGGVDVVLPGADGDEVTLTTLGPGEIVGELAVLTGNPRATSLAASGAGELTLLRLEREAVLELLREYPDVALAIIKVIAERLERTNAKAV